MSARASGPQMVLVVRNPARLLHGCVPAYRFDRSGGTVGSRGADWSLADDGGTIAITHCEIRWDEGDFCVIDRSGRTRINGSDAGMGEGRMARLSEADTLHLGHCEVSIRLQEGAISLLEPVPAGELDRWLATGPSELSAMPLARPLALNAVRDPLLALDDVGRPAPSSVPMPLLDETHFGRSSGSSTRADLAASRLEAIAGPPSIQQTTALAGVPCDSALAVPSADAARRSDP
jgi:type VI secretion system protein ImpI